MKRISREPWHNTFRGSSNGSDNPEMIRPQSYPLAILALFGLALWGLAGFGFVTSELLAQQSKGPQGRRRPAVQASARAENAPATWKMKVEGAWMTTTGEAVDSALKQAQAELTNQLRRQRPPNDWEPTEEFVRKLVRGQPEISRKELPDIGTMYQAAIRLEVSKKDNAEMARFGRHGRTERRQLRLAAVLGGLVALLAAIAGYIRLDERSKGFYNAWLKLAAVGVVVAVITILWHFFRH
jgi:hypothetical protein